MATNGALVAAIIGAAGLGAYLLATRSRTSDSSQCDALCDAQARITGISSDACKKGVTYQLCKAASEKGPLGAAQSLASLVSKIPNPVASLLGATGCKAQCPSGTTLGPTRQTDSRAGIYDHRDGDTSALGCFDMSGAEPKLVATVGSDCTVRSYTTATAPIVPPPIRPVTQPGVVTVVTNADGTTKTVRDHRTA
jgi:hypothetical protein